MSYFANAALILLISFTYATNSVTSFYICFCTLVIIANLHDLKTK
jgi:hypothetical protein